MLTPHIKGHALTGTICSYQLVCLTPKPYDRVHSKESGSILVEYTRICPWSPGRKSKLETKCGSDIDPVPLFL